jgi:hypothetical protein
MKKTFFQTILFATLLCFQSCKKNTFINTPGAAPGLYYFEITDKEKIKFFEDESVIFKYNKEDTKLKKAIGLISFTINDEKNAVVFFNSFSTIKSKFTNGINSFELIYPNGTIDKINVNVKFSDPNTDGGIVTFDQLLYNDIEVKSETRKYPVFPSYYFVLK